MKITVRNTCIIVNDYDLGDCEKLENTFKKYNPITHSFDVIGMFYDKENRRLFLPAGLDLWKIKNYFSERYYDRQSAYPYQEIENIKCKARPRDEEQMEALRFMCGLNEYEDNTYNPQLSVNLNTGKGKTYSAIATICFLKIKSIIITGSNSLLSQWETEILRFTNLKNTEIVHISGSDNINMILSGNSKKAKDGKIFLCSHGTLRSFGDRYGWDKVEELFKYLGIGLKFFDEAHTNFDNMLMIDFFTNVYKTYYVTATPGRSDWKENHIFQLSLKNVPAIDLFDENNDPHTDYIAIKYNSHPSARQISALRNKYGLDRMGYVDYVTLQPEFYQMMRIVMDFIIRCKGRALIYIGTNEGILRVYYWILQNYPEFAGDIGIFSSLVGKEDKLEEKKKKILISTTKSAGLGEHIEGLKLTVLAAEPFKSEILARQTLGRTRDSNTKYIELVDMGFKQIRSFYYSKLKIFNKYASSTSDTMIDSYELGRRAEILEQERYKPNAIQPIRFIDNRFDFAAAIPRRKVELFTEVKRPISFNHFSTY